MNTIELHLDEETLARAQRLAESRRCRLEELLRDLIEQLEPVGAADPVEDPLLGMFRQEPNLLDEAAASAMRAREEHPLRRGSA